MVQSIIKSKRTDILYLVTIKPNFDINNGIS